MSQLVRDAAAPGAARSHWDPSVGGKAAARVGPARFVSLPDYAWVPQEAAPRACVSTFQRLLWALHGKVSGTALGASAPAAAAHGAGPRHHHHRGSRAWYDEVQTVLRQLRDAWNGTPFAFLRVAAAAATAAGSAAGMLTRACGLRASPTRTGRQTSWPTARFPGCRWASGVRQGGRVDPP